LGLASGVLSRGAVCGPQSAVHSPQSTVHSPQSTVHSPQSAVHSPQSAVRGPQSTRHDIVSSQPQDHQLVLLRRAPGDCPPLAANWDAGNARFQCGPEAWVIPWQFVSHWRALEDAPAWPQPASGALLWQDIYLCPPADAQPVWLRRRSEPSAAFRAVFDRTGFAFMLSNGWRIQWYEAWKWRPR
jgi:hypothetical protein